jgi:protein involved in polysaccharide export with SLBB domain
MKAHVVSLLCLALVAVGAGCAAKVTGGLPPAARKPANQPAGPTAAFEPGDTLELYVDEDASFNGQYLVREGGYILIPKIGRIPVQGIDHAAAETRIKDVFEKRQLKHARITVERNPGPQTRETQAGAPQLTIYLTGSVPNPGVHNVPVLAGRRLGVYEVLLVSGGSSRFANVSRVELLRVDASGRRQRTVIDLRPIRDGKVDDVPVADGDIIHVPEKVIGF